MKKICSLLFLTFACCTITWAGLPDPDRAPPALRDALRYAEQVRAYADAAKRKAPEVAGTWAYAYGGSGDETAFFVGETPAGGLYIDGDTDSFGAGSLDLWLAKLNASGAIQWQKTYGTSGWDMGSIDPVAGGGFAAWWQSQPDDISEVDQVYLARLDDTGNIQWAKSYVDVDNYFDSILPLAGGGYLLWGSVFEFIPTPPYFAIYTNAAILDADGNVVWYKRYTSSDSQYVPIFILPLSGGGYLLSGTTFTLAEDDPDPDMFLAKLDASGNILWQKVYGGPGTQSGAVYSELADGYFVVGFYQPPDKSNSDGWILKVDGSGSIVWEKRYGGALNDSAYVVPTMYRDGTYFVTGITESYGPGEEDVWLFKMDGAGNILWQFAYGGTGEDNGLAMFDADGGFLLEGYTRSYGSGGEDVFVAKTDAGGAVQWGHTYGGPNEDDGWAVRTAAGGLLLSGWTESWGAGGEDAWVLSLNANGTMGGTCPLVGSFPVTADPISIAVTNTSSTVVNATLTAESHSMTPGSPTITVTTPAFDTTEICTATPHLNATAAADVTSGDAPLLVNFTGTAADGTPPYTYDWNFGDGGSSTDQNPSHTYATGGDFLVSLTVTDAASDTAVDDHLEIHVTAAEPLDATAWAAPLTGEAPLDVAFDGEASGGMPPYSYDWDFGDGSAHSSAEDPSHTYGTAGTYTATLTVTDAERGVDADTVTVVVLEGCTLTCTAGADPTSGPSPLAVAFTATAVPLNCTGDPSFSWDFGDGAASNEQNPGHTYDNDGTYLWELTVTIEDQTCTRVGTVFVGDAPELPGDCDFNGAVSIGEVQKGINMFLGTEPIACGVDTDLNGNVSVGEVQTVINGFLNG